MVMEKKTQYQMRVRKDRTADHVGVFSGMGTVTEVITYTVTLPNIQAVLDKTAELEQMEGYEIISIILIDEDNREQLGEDFEWDEE